MSAYQEIKQLEKHLNRCILGQETLVNRLLIALLADGHLLVEGTPGLAKTSAVKALAAGLEGDFHRIQFTPDLLPADIIGTEVFQPKDGDFTFRKGPLFHNFVLADEINRSPAKVQSALLEAMGERQVTVGRKTYPLADMFLVMATQNPIEQDGTYPLPESQRDRFLLYVRVNYPDSGSELDILRLVRGLTREGKSVADMPTPRISQATVFEARRQILDQMARSFERVVLIAADDLYLELINQRGEDTAVLFGYQRYDISDFGYARLEELAHKWFALGRPEADPVEIRERALELCEQVQSALGVAGLPHTPWLLIVVLEQAEQAEPPIIAARNGNYGHLYHAVITVALARSRQAQFDLSGKFIYLAEFAHRLYEANRSTLTETETREFHTEHCERYELPFDYEHIRDDFIDTRILRLDGDEIAFRSRWVYCFFVAWWLNRNMRQEKSKRTVGELTARLHHETSANILVFLAHLSEDPLVIGRMREAAAALFADSPEATMDEDIGALNELDGVDGFFRLPASSPDVNRRIVQDARDERVAKETRRSQDGRQVDPLPDSNGGTREAMHDKLTELRAALKTIRILGQVLRNGASSIEGAEKLAIMKEVFGVGRRVLGMMYSYQQELRGIIRYLRHRLFRILIEIHRADKVGRQDADANDAIGLSRTELRSFWKEARDLANRYWFDLNWMATFAMVKRMGIAVGLPLLDGTLAKLVAQEKVLPNGLGQLVVRLNRRSRSIPADDMVRLHKALMKADNRLARVVLEAMSWERMLLFETDHAQVQQICQQMDIQVPVKSLDASRKKFGRIPRRK